MSKQSAFFVWKLVINFAVYAAGQCTLSASCVSHECEVAIADNSTCIIQKDI